MNKKLETASARIQFPTILGSALSIIIASLGSVAHAAPVQQASAQRPILLCRDVRDTLGKDAALRAAEAAALGTNTRFQEDNAQADDASDGCTSLAALLKFGDVQVLITAETDPGPGAPGESAHLSAYFLRTSGGALRRVAVKRKFADGIGSFGNAGDISSARFGSDDGIIVSGSTSQQGFSSGSANLYAFRHGSIVSLGTIPTGWSNGGSENDDSKVVSITGKADTGLPQPDCVRVTYTRSVGSRSSTKTSIWRSEAGKFVLEAGSVPQEIITAFALPPDVVAGNGTPIATADLAQTASAGGSHPKGAWAISDAGLVPLAREVAEAVNRDPAYPPVCKLVGQEMTPSLSESARTYFVTTANQCDAAQGLGPVWIVSVPPNGQAEIVFNAIRHSVRAQSAIHGGFHDLIVSDDAKTPASGETYAFDGKAYRKSGS
ncbi:MAG: hypothetical protein AB1586_16085 [Pseudomonadota bacterium]